MLSASSSGKPPRMPVVTPSRQPEDTNNMVAGNKKVDAELQALKQRGLAKILNKHFTETAALLAQEKAAADAAVADLEERKARTSEFKESGGLCELSPTDKLAVAANQWRNECRRKERETILLYQSYVQKFGSTGMAAIPSFTPDSTRTSAPPPRERPLLNVESDAVPTMASQIETTLDAYLKQGGLSLPSAQILGKDETFQNAAQKEQAEFRTFYMRQLEQQGVDAVASSTYKMAGGVDPFAHRLAADEDQLQSNIDAAIEATSLSFVEVDNGNNGGGDNDDECSVVSGLTTLHSAMTRELLQDCERSVVTFLREEQANIRLIMEQDGSATSTTSPEYTVGDASYRATREAENMVQQMQDILHEYQSKHGDASGVMDRKKQQQATLSSAREPRPYPTNNPHEEWVVYYDEFYQQEYYHEKHSNRTQWEPPNGDSKSATPSQFSHEQVMPDHAFSRVAGFRAKRRKSMRRRKIGRVLAAACLALVGLAYHQLNQLPDVRNGRLTPVQAFVQLTKAQWDHFTGEEARRLEAEEKARMLALGYDEEETARRLAEQAEAERKALMLRPWACNLPLSYLFHHRCRRLARQNPAFDVRFIIDLMLQ